MSPLVPKDKPLTEQKKYAEDALSEAFARDLITMEEFEIRVAKIQTAQSNRDIVSELDDLPDNFAPAVSEDEETDLSSLKPYDSKIILGSSLMRGAKLKSKKINSKIILGEQKLDYSKTVLAAGKYVVNATVVLGSLIVIVPEGYAVTIDMQSILSGVEEKSETAEPRPGTPEIIIKGNAVLSSVIVKVKKNNFIDKIKKLIDYYD